MTQSSNHRSLATGTPSSSVPTRRTQRLHCIALALGCVLLASCSQFSGLFHSDMATPTAEERPAAQGDTSATASPASNPASSTATSATPCTDCADNTAPTTTTAISRGEAQPTTVATAADSDTATAEKADASHPAAETATAQTSAPAHRPNPAAAHANSAPAPAHTVSSKDALDAWATGGAKPYYVNVGAFAIAANAEHALEKVQAAGVTVFTQEVDTPKGHLTRVRAGPYSTRADADAIAQKIKALDLDAIVMR